MSIKVGVVIPQDVARDVEELMKSLGYKSRSKLVQDALRYYITATAWRKEKGEVVGAIAVLYNHDISGVDESLTDIQHEYLDIIISALHAHLTKSYCLQLILIRGDVSKVKELYNKLNNVRGVIHIAPIVMKVSSH